MALTIQNTLRGPWESVRGTLMADLSHIVTAVNQFIGTQPLSDTNTTLKAANGGRGGYVELTDGVNIALDASAGSVFHVATGGDRTINVPTNPTSGMEILIIHSATGSNRTLALAVVGQGCFRFGTDVASLSATTSGKSDYIRCVYTSTFMVWDVVDAKKGY